MDADSEKKEKPGEENDHKNRKIFLPQINADERRFGEERKPRGRK